MRTRLRAWVMGLTVALMLTAGTACQSISDWQPTIGTDPGKPADFDQSFAAQIFANYEKCPVPADSRQRSNEYGPDWFLWVKFNVTSESQAEHVVNDCLGSPVPYAPSIWILHNGQVSTAWGPKAAPYDDFGLFPGGAGVQSYGIADENHGAKVNRAIIVSRHTGNIRVFRVDVWITKIQ